MGILVPPRLFIDAPLSETDDSPATVENPDRAGSAATIDFESGSVNLISAVFDDAPRPSSDDRPANAEPNSELPIVFDTKPVNKLDEVEAGDEPAEVFEAGEPNFSDLTSTFAEVPRRPRSWPRLLTERVPKLALLLPAVTNF